MIQYVYFIRAGGLLRPDPRLQHVPLRAELRATIQQLRTGGGGVIE